MIFSYGAEKAPHECLREARGPGADDDAIGMDADANA